MIIKKIIPLKYDTPLFKKKNSTFLKDHIKLGTHSRYT